MKYHDIELRIPYAETDPMGVVYYANYLIYFERARTEFMRQLGIVYKDMEQSRNLFLPVMSASCEYFSPGKYDDLLRVRTTISKLGHASIQFRYEIFRAEGSRGREPEPLPCIARGYSKHPFVDKNWKPTRIPSDIFTKLRIQLDAV